MSTEEQRFQTLVANDCGFMDLDEYECADKFRTVIFNLSDSTRFITLDLRQCWIDYSHSAIYIDAAITKLQSHSNELKNLVVRTNVDLGSKESMACLFFQASRELGCAVGMTPSQISEKTIEFCTKNNFSLAIEIFPFEEIKDPGNPKIRYDYATQ